MKGSDYFGPVERFQILADLFEMDVGEVEKNLCIEPPFWCDYGKNIKFMGEVRWLLSFSF
jgi:maltose O-acetyltransferase